MVEQIAETGFERVFIDRCGGMIVDAIPPFACFLRAICIRLCICFLANMLKYKLNMRQDELHKYVDVDNDTGFALRFE